MAQWFSCWIGRCAALLAAMVACAVLCGSGLLPGAIAREHGWALGPARGPAGSGDGVMVHHLPAGGAWGEVRPGVRLTQPPAAMAAVGDEFVFVLPPSDASATVLGVRSTRARQLPSGLWQYDRHRVLPPIPLGVTSTGDTDDAPEPNVESDTEDLSPDELSQGAEPDEDAEPFAAPLSTLVGFGAGRGAGPDGRVLVALLESATERRLLVLARDGWRIAPLPEGIAPVGRVWLAATDGTVALAQRMGGGSLRVWSIGVSTLLRQVEVDGDAAAVARGWQPWSAPVPTGDFELFGIDGQLVLVSGVQGDGKRRIALLRPGRSQPIAELAEQPGTALAITGLGTGGAAAVMAVGFPDEGQGSRGAGSGRPRVWVWSLGGVLLYEGETIAIAPVSMEQVGLLGLLLLSLFASILVFIARPMSTWNPPINLPEGASLASPGRRLLAFVLDIVPGMFASSVLFPTGALSGPLEALGGLGPLLFVVLVTIAHSTITEAWVGRTLGKLTMGLRTIDAGGGRPSPRQALLRTVVKVLCPPLMFFTLANPFMPGPAGFDTVVVVDDWKRDHGTNDRDGDDEGKA